MAEFLVANGYTALLLLGCAQMLLGLGAAWWITRGREDDRVMRDLLFAWLAIQVVTTIAAGEVAALGGGGSAANAVIVAIAGALLAGFAAGVFGIVLGASLAGYRERP